MTMSLCALHACWTTQQRCNGTGRQRKLQGRVCAGKCAQRAAASRNAGLRRARARAETDQHDQLAKWLFKTGLQGKDGSKAKYSSYENKYIRFCLSEHSVDAPKLPMFDHFNLINLMLFAIWCPSNGVEGGWDSVGNYIGAVVKFAARHGDVADPRAASGRAAWWWDEFVARFQENVFAVRKLKLRMQPAHHQAMAMDFDMAREEDVRDAALYSFLMFFAVRVGHASPKSSKDLKHCLRFKDVMFLPNLAEAETVFILMSSTKTRKIAEGKPTWQAVSKLDANACSNINMICPVRCMQRYFVRCYGGNPNAPLFKHLTKEGFPLGRTHFTNVLRARLKLAERWLDRPVLTKHMSGISWRKGGLSALAGQVTTDKLADYGDHQDVRSTREYTSNTIEEGGCNARLIANRYS